MKREPPNVPWGLFDRALAAVAPTRAARRYAARVALGNLRRSYEGAQRGRGTEGWRAAGTAADAEIAGAAPILRDRMRDLVRNNPLAARAVSVLVNSIVGPGIRPRAASGDPALNRKVDDLWKAWSARCDADGHTDFHGLLGLAVREMIEGGDVFAVRRRRRVSDALPVPLQIELKEADHLDAARFDNRPDGGRVSQGIEYDREGHRRAYWLFPDHPGDQSPIFARRLEAVRVEAGAVAHLFERQRVQSRGVPWGVPAMRAIRDVDDWQSAELVRKKTEACLVGIVFGDDESQQSIAPVIEDAAGNRVEQFEPGLIAYARGGKDIKFNQPTSTAGVYEWHRVQLHIIAAGFRVPYELMTGDLSQVNFSSSRIGINEFKRMLDVVQWQIVIPMFCEKVWGWFIEAAFTAGLIPRGNIPAEWAPPKFESVNPWQDAQTDLLETRAGFATLPQQIAKRGYDPKEVLAEWAEAAALLDELKLVLDSDPRKVTQAGLTQVARGGQQPANDAARRTATNRNSPMPKDRIDLPVLGRAAQLRAESADEAARTVEIVWTTGATVRRRRFWDEDIDEELLVAPGAVRLDRLNGGAPFLNSHNGYALDAVLGVVAEGSARIDTGTGTATIRFSEREDVQPIFRDIAGGIIRNVSVGYRVHRYEIEKRDGQVELWRAVDWEPMEISAVAIGADPGARVRGETAPAEALNACVVTRHDTPAASAANPTRKDMPNKAAAAVPEGTDEARDADAIETRAVPASPAPAAAAGAAPAPAGPSIDEIRAQERRRAADISGLCQRHALGGELAADMIARGISIDEARAEVLDKLADLDAPVARRSEPIAATARAGADTSYRDAVGEALLHRFMPGVHALPERAREFRGLSLIEMAKDALERRGARTRGMSKMEVASEALGMRAGAGYHSTSDFPSILANVANKTLRAAYDSTPRTFTGWARRATIVDFKPVQRTQLGGAPDLQRVLESGEFSYGTIGEGKEVYALATYGRIVAITRQTLINDDLDAFTRIPSAFGAAAADLESDIVYSILTANAAMGDGVALFHATHANLGTAAVIGETSLSEAYRMFGQQKGIEDRLISILPRYIIVPPGKRSLEARKQITATTPANTQDVNTFAGRLEVIEEPRLIPGAGQDPWFLAADPARIDTVEYAYLEGQQGVTTETRMGFEVDGLEIKARHDFASKAIDWRGLYKNAGAAA